MSDVIAPNLDTIPQPLSLAEALERRAAKEKELLEPTPAAAPSAAASVAPSPLPSFTPLPTPMVSTANSTPSTSHPPSTTPASSRGKGRAANGTGRGETAPRRQSTREPKPRRRGENLSAVQSVSSSAPAAADSQQAKTNGTRRTARGSRSRVAPDDSVSRGSRSLNGASHHSPSATHSARSLGNASSAEYPPVSGADEHWVPTGSTQLIGGPGVPFGRNGLGLAENPGRTIYSQQRQPNR